VILGLIIVQSVIRPGPTNPNFFLTVASPSASQLGSEKMLQVMAGVGATAVLKRYDQTPESLETAFVVDFKHVSHLEQVTNRLREMCSEVKISCLDDRGING
jgi:hypothetical protein